MALWLSPLLQLWAHLRVRAIISPAQGLGHLLLGMGGGTTFTLPPCLCLQALIHSLLAPPSSPPLPLVPCLEPEGTKPGTGGQGRGHRMGEGARKAVLRVLVYG